MFDYYSVTLTLIRDMLATNPCDPNIHDTHIIARQRKLILEKSKLNSEINKYLDQIQISKEKSDEELDALFARLEKLTGIELTSEERKEAVAGNLAKLKETFESLKSAGTTIFFWNKEKDRPMIGSHMIYGFLKAAGEALSRCVKKGEKRRGMVMESSAYTSSLINQHVKCAEQFITIDTDVKRNEDGTTYYHQRSLRVKTAKGDRTALAKSEVVPCGAKIEFTLKVLKGSEVTEEVLRRLFAYGECVGLGQHRSAEWGQFTYELSSTQK